MITKEQLLELFTYDRERGVLIWKNPPCPHWYLYGNIAGSINRNGYRKVKIQMKMYLVHRLIWFIEHNEFPRSIHHKNEIFDDNRIENLEATRRIKGYTKCKITGKYKSRILIDKKLIHLGYFNTEEEAHDRYLQELRRV